MRTSGRKKQKNFVSDLFPKRYTNIPTHHLEKLKSLLLQIANDTANLEFAACIHRKIEEAVFPDPLHEDGRLRFSALLFGLQRDQSVSCDPVAPKCVPDETNWDIDSIPDRKDSRRKSI